MPKAGVAPSIASKVAWIDHARKDVAMTRFGLAVLAYLLPTFALGFVWHLVLFEHAYKALAIYRADIIIPFGFLAMLIQGTIFAWIFQRALVPWRAPGWLRTAVYGVGGALLSWSFTTIAVAAKNVMTSVPDYVAIETGFTVIQWIMVAPLTVMAFAERSRRAA
jgi:hypothetical protein